MLQEKNSKHSNSACNKLEIVAVAGTAVASQRDVEDDVDVKDVAEDDAGRSKAMTMRLCVVVVLVVVVDMSIFFYHPKPQTQTLSSILLRLPHTTVIVIAQFVSSWV